MGPTLRRSPAAMTASEKARPFRRVSGDHRRTTVPPFPRRIRQCMGRTPRAASRRVQRGPEPTEHLADFRRTSCPSRAVPQTRRTSSPDETTSPDKASKTDEEAVVTISEGDCPLLRRSIPGGRTFVQALNPLGPLAYERRGVKGVLRVGRASRSIGEKRVYNSAGFVDYRIANFCPGCQDLATDGRDAVDRLISGGLERLSGPG